MLAPFLWSLLASSYAASIPLGQTSICDDVSALGIDGKALFYVKLAVAKEYTLSPIALLNVPLAQHWNIECQDGCARDCIVKSVKTGQCLQVGSENFVLAACDGSEKQQYSAVSSKDTDDVSTVKEWTAEYPPALDNNESEKVKRQSDDEWDDNYDWSEDQESASPASAPSPTAMSGKISGAVSSGSESTTALHGTRHLLRNSYILIGVVSVVLAALLIVITVLVRGGMRLKGKSVAFRDPSPRSGLREVKLLGKASRHRHAKSDVLFSYQDEAEGSGSHQRYNSD